MCLLAQQTIML